MSTTNNNTANYTVENLVAKYREYVKVNGSGDYVEYKDKNGMWHDKWAPIEYLDAERQLLVTIYKKVVGDNAVPSILDALSNFAEDFHHNALDENELSFLIDHFPEVSTFIFDYWGSETNSKRWNYGFERPSQKAIAFLGFDPRWWNYSKNQPSTELQKEVQEAVIKPGMTIFIANSGYCDIAMLFPDCIIKGFTHHKDNWVDKVVWALGQIRLYAAGIKSEILPYNEDIDDWHYMEDVDYAIWGSSYHSSYKRAEQFYQHMKPNSKLLLFMDKEDAAGETKYESKDLLCLRRRLVEEKNISTIVSFEEFDSYIEINRHRICVFADKAKNDTVIVKNSCSGQEIELSSHMLDAEILWPSYYIALKPKDGIALSEIVSFHDLGRRWEKDIDRNLIIEREDGDWILSENAKKMPVVAPVDMSTEYKDANLCEVQLKLAGDSIYNQWIGWLRKIEQPCILLFGKKEKFVVGYINQLPEEGIATLDSVVCLIPKKDIDVRYVAALLLTPEVKNQIMSICEGSVNDSSFPLIINKVIVPNHNDKERLAFLSETNYKALISSKKEVEKSFDKKFEKMKADYINEVRMRKHDMRPHLRQLASSERLMLHYIDNINNLEELKKAMKKQIVSSHDALESISELVDHLSDEERFGEPERVNLNKFFEDLEINHNENDCFTLETSCEEAISQIRGESLAEIVEHAQAKGISLEQFVKQYNADTNALYVNIAPVDLNRLVNNIVENARRHGFTDKCRNDYYFSVNVKINNQRNMYQIDFCNNGNPLPVGMTKDRYGLKGEKAGANAGTGSGGYIVRSIVEHYGGDYDVFTKDGITTIRIYLPKSSVE